MHTTKQADGLRQQLADAHADLNMRNRELKTMRESRNAALRDRDEAREARDALAQRLFSQTSTADDVANGRGVWHPRCKCALVPATTETHGTYQLAIRMDERDTLRTLLHHMGICEMLTVGEFTRGFGKAEVRWQVLEGDTAAAREFGNKVAAQMAPPCVTVDEVRGRLTCRGRA